MSTRMTTHSAYITESDFDRLSQLIDSPRYTLAAARRFGLRSELEQRTVVTAGDVPKSVVTMNSRVKVRDLKSSQRETYTLVYPEEADIDENRLSVLAPLGTALLGRSAGEVVEFDAPAGKRRMRVERVVYQPEAAGDLHL